MQQLLSMSRERWLAICFILSLGLNLCVAFLVGGLVNSDYARTYRVVGLALAEGQGLTQLPDLIALQYPIGFPLFIAAAFRIAWICQISPETAITIAQAILSASTIIIIFLLTEAMFGRLPAILAAIICSFYPRFLWFIKHPNSEIPFMFGLYSALLCSVFLVQRQRLRYAVAIGICCGVCALFRPIALFLGPTIGLAMFFAQHIAFRKRVIFLGLIIIMTLITIAPWEIYLYQRTGHLLLLSNNGASSIYDGLTWAVMFGEAQDQGNVPDDILAFMQRARVGESELRYDSAALGAFVRQEFSQHPLTLIKIAGYKIWRSLYASVLLRNDMTLLLLQLPILIGFAWGWWVVWRTPRYHWYALLGALLWCYFWGMTTIVLSIARYMIPIAGLFLIFFSYALATLITRYQLIERWDGWWRRRLKSAG